MRFGSHTVPMRVMFSVICLSCLGIAATIPTGADQAVDPIMTQSISKVDDADPTMTDLPPETDVAPMNASGTVDTASQTPRQILPQAADAIAVPERRVAEPVALAAPASSDPASTVSAPSEFAASDPVVSPVMGAAQAQPMQDPTMQDPTVPNAVGVQPIAGNAVGASGAIILALDHARVMRMVGDVATVIIGNPAIADVSMPDPQTVVLTGKSYGETNMVMLDAQGQILAEQMLQVTVRGQSLVSVYRGVERTTLSCSPTCEIRPTPGDTPALVEAGLSAFQARNAAALEAANQP